MKEILFFEHKLILHNSGILFWPKNDLAVVSDLHLEKSSYFAKKGNFLPPYESFDTLKNLNLTLKNIKVKNLIFLGDVFHDYKGFKRLDLNTKMIFEDLMKKFNTKFIIGNHDENIVIPNVKIFKNFKVENINFIHRLTESNSIEISGHYHPKYTLKINGNKISQNCFVVCNKKIILPAFGKFTGGLDVKHTSLSQILKGFRDYYLINDKKIYHIPGKG